MKVDVLLDRRSRREAKANVDEEKRKKRAEEQKKLFKRLLVRHHAANLTPKVERLANYTGERKESDEGATQQSMTAVSAYDSISQFPKDLSFKRVRYESNYRHFPDFRRFRSRCHCCANWGEFGAIPHLDGQKRDKNRPSRDCCHNSLHQLLCAGGGAPSG